MIRVLFFGSLRDALGRSELAWPEQGTVASIRTAVAAHLGTPGLALLEASVRAAVNQVMAAEDCAVASGDELAFMPPVTGG